jgi:hypothetical protein
MLKLRLLVQPFSLPGCQFPVREVAYISVDADLRPTATTKVSLLTGGWDYGHLILVNGNQVYMTYVAKPTCPPPIQSAHTIFFLLGSTQPPAWPTCTVYMSVWDWRKKSKVSSDTPRSFISMSANERGRIEANFSPISYFGFCLTAQTLSRDPVAFLKR